MLRGCSKSVLNPSCGWFFRSGISGCAVDSHIPFRSYNVKHFETSCAANSSTTWSQSIEIPENDRMTDPNASEDDEITGKMEDVVEKSFFISTESAIFPDLFLPDKTNPVLIGIDPDRLGALAALQWHSSTDQSLNGTDEHSGLENLTPTELASTASIEIFDMPVEVWKLNAREKKHPCAESLIALLATFLADTESHAIRAVVESGTPSHLSGKYAWYGNGFSTGLLTGLLLSKRIEYHRVQPVNWKRDMGLYKQGKEGSLDLARYLFPQISKTHLARKKDHGRAEALLLAAWALGIRAELR